MPSHSRTTASYPHAHKQLRARLLPAALGTMCPGDQVNGQPYRSRRCDGLMTDPHRMHLAHATPIALGGNLDDAYINCAACNLAAGATLGNTIRGRRRSPHPPRTHRRASRTWA